MTTNDKETPVTYVPQAFEKDGATDVAHTPAQAVALKFRGFKPVDVAPAADEKEPTYAELQAQARDLKDKGHDLKASGSYDDLLEAVTLAQEAQNEFDALEVTE